MRLLLAAFLALAPLFPPPSVLRVVDGDTLHVQFNGEDTTLRLLGIDCPESRHVAKCGKWRKGLSCDDEVKLGKAATVRAKELVPVKAPVTVETHGHDRYGRTLAYVTVDGRDLGLELLREGLCKDWSDKYPHPRGEAYRAATAKAR